MTILRNANLKNVLPDVSYKEKEGYFIYPDYLRKDKQVMGIKNYLHKMLSDENTEKQ